MTSNDDNNWLPERIKTESGELRRVGVEIELAGVAAAEMAALIQKLFGGRIDEKTRHELVVEGTEFGDFIVELDSSYLKEIARAEAEKQGDLSQLEKITAELLTKTSEQLVPWEIVSPPITFANAEKLLELIERLRTMGALGTRHAIQFAFGVHLNPELPNLDSMTIVNYLRAYFCLYDWIVAREAVDLTRKLTPYINHFKKPYIEKLVDWHYQPDLQQLIDDYLEANPTRNRSMDMLPLFAHLDEQRVKNVVDDDRINARPTFHYRLPNCDIDNPEWNLDVPWRLWLAVEKLSADSQRLKKFCDEYSDELSRLTHPLESRWLKRCEELMRA